MKKHELDTTLLAPSGPVEQEIDAASPSSPK